MRQLLYAMLLFIGSYIIGFVSGFQYLNQQDRYQLGYDTGDNQGYSRGYEQGACGIVRSVTGRQNCKIEEIRTASGKTIRAAISLPE